jgi:hypothetical protein
MEHWRLVNWALTTPLLQGWSLIGHAEEYFWNDMSKTNRAIALKVMQGDRKNSEICLIPQDNRLYFFAKERRCYG